MNLGDLMNSEKSREHLKIGGSLQRTYCNNVDISDGHIEVTGLRYDTGNVSKDEILSKDAKGILQWVENKQFNGWAFDDVIMMSSFSNTCTYVTATNMKWDGMFGTLNNRPSIDDTIPLGNTDSNLFYKVKNNLGEMASELLLLNDKDARIEFVNSNLFGNTLGNLAFETEDLVVLDSFKFREFTMIADTMKKGDLLRSTCFVDEHTNEIRNKVVWDNPFLNDDGSIKSSCTLVDDFISDQGSSIGSSVKIANINTFITKITNKINDVQNYLEENDIKNTIISNQEKGEYMITSNFLRDIDDTEKLFDFLNIGSISHHNTESVVVENLNVIESFTFGTYPCETETCDKFFSIDTNSNFNITLLPTADLDVAGIVQFNDDEEDSTEDKEDISSCNNVSRFENVSYTLEHLQSNLTDTSDDLRVFVNDLIGFDDISPSIFLTNDLISYRYYDIDKLEEIKVYQNLDIKKVGYTGSYTSLSNVPVHSNHLTNDIGALSKFKGFGSSDSLDLKSAHINLGLGNMCKQNNSTVDIIGGNAHLSSVYCKELTIPPPSLFTNVEDNVIISDKGQATWSPVNLANEVTFGVVKIIHDYKIDSRESVVLGENIKEMKRYFESLLDDIETKLTILELDT